MTQCPVCHDGTLEQQRIETCMRRGERWVVIRGVPAFKCDLCGETTFSQEVSERLVSLLSGEATGRPSDFVTCPLYEYDQPAATSARGAARWGVDAEYATAASTAAVRTSVSLTAEPVLRASTNQIPA